MEYVRLGSTGTKVSRFCLGCMTFGEPDRGRHSWTMGADQSRPIIRRALEAGINFCGTANGYSDASSEEIAGAARAEYARRDEIVIATKVFDRMRPGSDGSGLSRKAILREIDQSLKRLGTDYVDLYQTHRWDPYTPIEKTLEALHGVVKAGKVRYIGAPSMFARQFAKALHTSERRHLTRCAERVAQVGAQRGVPMAQVAQVAQHPGTTARIVGASKLAHVENAVAALKLDLSSEETTLFEAPSVPHATAGQ